MPTYYDILEVTPEATYEDIKKSYRRLALLYHPDLAQTPHVDRDFHEIQRAYKTLSDPDTRCAYDQKNGFLADIRAKLDSRRTKDGKTKHNTVNQSDEEWIAQVIQLRNSASRHPVYEREADRNNTKRQLRPDLEGKQKPKQAHGYGGRTVRIFLDRVKEGVLGAGDKTPSEQSEFDCVYPADLVKNLNHCTIDALESLHGTTREIEMRDNGKTLTARIRIPAGVRPDSILQIRTRSKSGEAVHVQIHITPHALVEREGPDVVVRVPITMSEAIRGTDLLVPTMEGCLKVTIPPGWSDARRLRLKGRGILDPISQKQGDLYVRTPIVLPDSLGEKAEDTARALDRLYSKDVRGHIPRSLASNRSE